MTYFVGQICYCSQVICKPNIMFSMTIRSSHEIKSERIDKIRKALGEKWKQHKLIFVTKQENVKIFSSVKGLNVQQYNMK